MHPYYLPHFKTKNQFGDYVPPLPRSKVKVKKMASRIETFINVSIRLMGEKSVNYTWVGGGGP
jgi:hypothetical protein